jgi:outer membrane protein TolC
MWALVVTACARYQYMPDPITPDANVEYLLDRSADEDEFLAFLSARGHSVTPWPPPAWDTQTLTLVAFYFNPRLRTARAAYELRRAELSTASKRHNPGVEIPLEHHSDTSGGRSPWLVGLITDLRFERRGKREARIELARAQVESGWIELEAAAWALRSELVRAIVDDWSAAREHNLLAQELELAEQSRDLIARRAEIGEAGIFELNQTRLELQRITLLRAGHEARRADARRTLLALTGLSETALQATTPVLVDPDPLPEADEVANTEIREMALMERFDLRQALADYAAAEALLKLEIEGQYPDIVLSPGFVFDQDDKIWALGTAWTVPLFHRNDGPIREALAARELEQARILALQSDIIHDIGRRRSVFLAQLAALEEADELVAQAERSEARIRRQFELGDTDRLALAGAGIHTARARRDALALRADAHKAAQALEDALQAPLSSDIDVAGAVRTLFAAEPVALGEAR